MKLVPSPSFALLLAVAAVLFSAIPGIGALSDAEMVRSCSVYDGCSVPTLVEIMICLCSFPLPLLFRSFEETPRPRRDFLPQEEDQFHVKSSY